MILCASLLFTVAVLLFAGAGNEKKDIYIAPDFRVVAFHGENDWPGKEITLSSLRGQPVALHFSASWCNACKFIYESLEPYRKRGLFVLGIGVHDKRQKFVTMIENMGIKTPVAYDTDNLVGKYRVHILPLTVFITKEGRIHSRAYGSFGGDRLEKIFRGLTNH